jgi:hypothetical protein
VDTGELTNAEDARPEYRRIVPGWSLPLDVATLSREQVVGGTSDGPIHRRYARAEAVDTFWRLSRDTRRAAMSRWDCH